MLVFIKLGGSLITNKRVEGKFQEEVVIRLASEIQSALSTNPQIKIVIGHGSGSFGHFAATRYQTSSGVNSSEGWKAFAHVATVAAELNYLVTRIFDSVGLPVWRLQPSASALCRDSEIVDLALPPITSALEHNLIPLVYGDVALDSIKGGTIISTEKIFLYLARQLPVDRILLLGEVDGVYDLENRVIPKISPKTFVEIQAALGGSAGVDVTGGMETKVRDMLTLVQEIPRLSIQILNGTQRDLLRKILLEQTTAGTLIHAGGAG